MKGVKGYTYQIHKNQTASQSVWLVYPTAASLEQHLRTNLEINSTDKPSRAEVVHDKRIRLASFAVVFRVGAIDK